MRSLAFALKISEIFENDIISDLENLARDYRNPAAHSKSFNQEEANQVWSEVFNLLYILMVSSPI